MDRPMKIFVIGASLAVVGMLAVLASHVANNRKRALEDRTNLAMAERLNSEADTSVRNGDYATAVDKLTEALQSLDRLNAKYKGSTIENDIRHKQSEWQTRATEVRNRREAERKKQEAVEAARLHREKVASARQEERERMLVSAPA